MASQARKDLELRMTVTTDATRATAAMQQLTREAERTGMAVKSIGTGPAGTPGAGGPKAEAGALGTLSKGFGAVAGVVAGAAAGVQAIGGLHKAILDLDNPLSTVREKTLGFAKAIPLLGGAISEFVSSVMDARERMLQPEQYQALQAARVESPIRMAQAAARHEFRQKLGGWNREVDAAGYAAQAAREFPTIGSGQALLTSAVGGVAGSFLRAGLDGIDPRVSAALEGVQAARRSYSATLGESEGSSWDVDDARLGADAAAREWQAAKARTQASLEAARGGGAGESRSDIAYRETLENGRRKLGDGVLGTAASYFAAAGSYIAPSWTGSSAAGPDPGSQQSLAIAATREKELEQKALLANADLEEKMRISKEKQLSLAQKSYEISKAETTLMKAQLAVADQRLARTDEQIAKARGGAAEFGAMDSLSQAGLLQVARKFKGGGREAVNADEFQMLAGNTLTRDLVGQRAERDGSTNPMFQALIKELGLTDAGELQRRKDQEKAEADKLRAEVSLKVQFDEEKFSDQVVKALEKFDFKALFLKALEFNLRKPDLAAAGAQAGLTQ
ncbi:hypothetical protein [Gemmata sp.]|uniref:hypothetical protein n=1 Tax=Gemmata sp. TaxID=1914242 RepID=UPI003F6E8C5D